MRQRFLNRNELVDGPGPAVIRALKNFSAEHFNYYLEGHGGSILVPKLSQRFGIPADRIMLYYGLEDFLRTLFGGLRPNRDLVLTNEFHYVFYDQIAGAKKIRIATFRLNKGAEVFSFDIDDCLRKIKKLKPSVLVITSPNNPTGNVIATDEFRKILQATSRKTLILLDGAYLGFQTGNDLGFYLRMLKQYPNFGLMRTFSKDYGLAGIRLGYVLCGRDVRKMLKDINRDLGFSRIQEELGMAALKSEDHLRQVIARVRTLRDWFTDKVNATATFVAYRSETNFVMIEARNNRALKQFLAKAKRLPVVTVLPYGKRFIRVTVGRKSDLSALLQIIKNI